VPLESIREILAGRHPYLIKLNAEGAEYEALPDLLNSGIRPEWTILMIHPAAEQTVDLPALLASAGYDVEAGDGRTNSARLHCRLRRR
jgi:hypothetical protein